MAKGVLEIVSDPDPGFYSHLFLVEKSLGGWRPVIDLSPLSEFIRQTPFRMETPSSVLLAVRKDDFLASADLKDVYFQIPVHPSSRKLPFHFKRYGLPVQSPVFRVIDRSASVHKGFHRLLRYLDNWLILSSSEAKTRQHVNQLLALCRSLGIVINKEKSDLSPSRSVEYLGMIIDTVSSVPHRETNPEIPLLSKEVLIPSEPHGPAVAGVVGTHVITEETGTLSKTPDAFAPMAS